ncbi:DUF3231 family protein [Cytobacillus sp. NCCP-133]|uniref:DUF3231 family protein n=1 Tax=Cytobacillus sp. NCCP-133 TaxID=766848 RepID=UPI00222EE042|nr:DUF3231 family protein [Cytobacillus sp. NCCP-133]GLB59584.1 membrane protein [Cytobacillus sp. NCCP-133]
MKNPFEAIAETIKNFADNEPKPPLHVGEVMDLWTLYTAFHEAHSLYYIALNMTTDTELLHTIRKAIEGSQADTQMIEDFLLKEGVPLPLTNAEKPLSDPDSVPEGVKLTDDEIANLISVKVAASIVFCAQAMIKTVRMDVGMLFFSIQVHLMEFASPLKNLMKQRGWLRIPPSYNPHGIPEKSK